MVQGAHEVSSTGNRYEIFDGRDREPDALARSTSADGVERYCMLQRLLPPYADHDELVQMFFDNARLAAQLRHPNLEAIDDVGTLGGFPLVASAYVHGAYASELLPTAFRPRPALPFVGVLSVIAAVAAGLQYTHERTDRDGRALVHGEVAPWNVRVGYDGSVKLEGLGAARLARRVAVLFEGRGILRGKVTHLSPEHCRGEPVDRRSDLFTLGMVMWDLLTGERLFRSETEYGILRAIVEEAVAPPSSVRPDLPRELDPIVLRLLAKSPAERFQRADQVIDALEAVAAIAGVSLSSAAVGQMLLDRCGWRPQPWC